MAEETEDIQTVVAPTTTTTPEPSQPEPPQEEAPPPPSKPWRVYISEDLPRTISESKDTAIRSARSIQQNSSTGLRTVQEFMPEAKSRFATYEDAFFNKLKDGLATGREHPGMTAGIALASSLLLLRGPRRFLFRQTLGRLQSEEARFTKAEKNVNMLGISVDLMKKESQKLLERATLAEKEMTHGKSELINTGKNIQNLTRSVDRIEAQATDLMELLREIPGRGALQLRAEVASVTSLLRQQRNALAKRTMKLSEMGVSV